MCNITITFYCAKEFPIDVKLHSKKIKFSTKLCIAFCSTVKNIFGSFV